MSLSFHWQRWALAVGDAALTAIGLYAAYALRFDFAIKMVYQTQFTYLLMFAIPIRLACFYAFDLYRGILRYIGLRELMALAPAMVVSTAILMALNAFLPAMFAEVPYLPNHLGNIGRVPFPVFLIELPLTLIAVAGLRLSRRLVLMEMARRQGDKSVDRQRVLILGAGDVGEVVCRQMLHTIGSMHIPVAFLDDDPAKKDRRIHGKPVLGVIDGLSKAIADYDIDEVVVAIPRIAPARLRDIVAKCEHERVAIRLVPAVQDMLTGRVSISRIRPVEIEDLLGREEIELELTDEQNYVKGKVVLVTGAGGSIGSELVRQVVRLEPAKVVIMGHGENSIYEVQMELVRKHPGLIETVIADIRDRDKLRYVLGTHRPNVVFHAAAHKHVPLMESDPDEAVKNNVVGTRNLAETALEVGVSKFILISSDKAVRPTNVMGATKRVAEMILFTLAEQFPDKTQFVAVRFGNVLGSRGSVVPLFKRQIAAGGPVTLTHPDVTRFFMTIPEAVRLVIQAGAMPDQRRLFLLDMGQPVKIVDLARNLIRLSGFEPDVDIPIVFTGLRPGEKLYEELLTDDEGVRATPLGKIFRTEPDSMNPDRLKGAVRDLEEAAYAFDGDRIRDILKGLVPDYTPMGAEGIPR